MLLHHEFRLSLFSNHCLLRQPQPAAIITDAEGIQ